MRSILLLTAVIGACVAVTVKLLPDEANAKSSSSIPTQEIQSIAIDGGRGLPQAALKARISSVVGELVDEQRLERDRAAIETELQGRGYLDARAERPSVTFGTNGGAYVVFNVDRGPMFHLRAIVVSGPGKREAGVVTLLAGDEASRDRIEQARQTLLATLERFAQEPRTDHGKRAVVAPQVDVVIHTDVQAAALDVELVTR